MDEADYAFIVNQVRNAEFNNELKRRVEALRQQQQVEQEREEAKLETKHQQELYQKEGAMKQLELEMAQLKKDLQAAEQQKNAAVQLALAEKEKMIGQLRAQLTESVSKEKVAVLKE